MWDEETIGHWGSNFVALGDDKSVEECVRMSVGLGEKKGSTHPHLKNCRSGDLHLQQKLMLIF